jgi:peptidyl-prolyl cis-trans isomerase C
MKIKKSVLCLCAFTLIAGGISGGMGYSAAPSASGDIAAVVNGVNINHQMVLDILTRLEQETGNKLNDEMRQKLYAFVLNQLVEDELLYQAAKAEKRENSPEVLKKVKEFKERVEKLQQEQVRRWAREDFLASKLKSDITEAMVKKEIDDRKDMAQVSLNYFGVTDKKKAESAAASLGKDPKKFKEVAQKHGEGNVKVRDMAPQLVENLPQFLGSLKEALSKNKIKKGEVFSKPIQVGNSFVIFLIKDLVRPAHPELLKEFVAQDLQKRKTRELVEALKKKAKIEIKGTKAS